MNKKVGKTESVLKYYVLCNKLKNLIRTGWKDWKVNSERLESVAEHVYGVQMLAIAMKSEFQYDVDLSKVLKMLAIHETEEIVIGDLTLFDIGREEKQEIGHLAVEDIFSNLIERDEYKKLIFEFDERTTKEAKFAYYCDKLEADLQARIYELDGKMDASQIKNNDRYLKNDDVKNLIDSGLSWGQMWMEFGQKRYGYDEHFMEVSEFAKNNDFFNNTKSENQNCEDLNGQK